MSGSATRYLTRFYGPEILEAGRDSVLTCEVWLNDGLVLPASGTLTVISPDNTTVVSARAVTFPASVATCTVLSTDLTAYDPSDGWRFEWILTIGTEVHTFTREGALVYRRLYCPITAKELIERHSDLQRRKPAQKASYQEYIDAAWGDIEDMMIAAGKRPWLTLSVTALREPVRLKALECIYEDFSVGGPETAEWARMLDYRERFSKCWDSLVLTQRDPTTGAAADAGHRRGMQPTMFLTSRQ